MSAFSSRNSGHPAISLSYLLLCEASLRSILSCNREVKDTRKCWSWSFWRWPPLLSESVVCLVTACLKFLSWISSPRGKWWDFNLAVTKSRDDQHTALHLRSLRHLPRNLGLSRLFLICIEHLGALRRRLKHISHLRCHLRLLIPATRKKFQNMND